MSLVVFISGRGSNLAAILDSPVGAQVRAVFSNRHDAEGLAKPQAAKIPTHAFDERDYATREEFESKFLEYLPRYKPRLIALAGFMKILSPQFIQHYPQQIVNIHPSLLPHFRGLNTHQRALDANATEHGCSVHWVSEECDGGEVIAQQKVAVEPNDTEETLAQRVLAAEHELYPKVLAQLLAAQH